MTGYFTNFLSAMLVVAPASVAMAEGFALKFDDTDAEPVIFTLQSSQSDWTGSPGWESVSMTAKPQDAAVLPRYKSLAIGFAMMNGMPGNAEARLLVEDNGAFATLFASSEADSIDITLEEMNVVEDGLSISGQFHMLFGPSDNFGRDINLADPVKVTGTFDVTLPPL